jgi:hypothetical protein
MNLKKIILPCLGGLALFAASAARAWTYTDGDVLLIFRASNKNNVEFDLGNISQFLGFPNGYTNVVTNWNLSVVTSNYALTNGNVQFAVIAATKSPSSEAWVSDTQPLTAEFDVTTSKWNNLYSVISAVGNGPTNDNIQTEVPPGTNYVNINPAGTTGRYSFDYTASDGGTTPSAIPLLGANGGVTASVTGVTPTSVLFYEVDAHSTPEPAATLVGSFTLSASGTLVFQAGPLLDAPTITSIAASNDVAAVTFTTKPAVKYQLIYSTLLSNSRTNWAVLPSPVAGTGAPGKLHDNSATNTARYYSVESYP